MSADAKTEWTAHKPFKKEKALSSIDVNTLVTCLEDDNKPSRVIPLTAARLQITVQMLDKSKPIVDWETHEVDQIVRVEKGMLIVMVREGDKRVTLHEGEVAVITRGYEHKLEALGDGQTVISSIYLGKVH